MAPALLADRAVSAAEVQERVSIIPRRTGNDTPEKDRVVAPFQRLVAFSLEMRQSAVDDRHAR